MSDAPIIEDVAGYVAAMTQLDPSANGQPGKGKLRLPPVPPLGDVTGLCAWLTAVFALDPRHPIVSGERQGMSGPLGHIELRRAQAPSIRFEPVTRLNTPLKLTEALNGYALNSDEAVPTLDKGQCAQIALAVRRLCGHAEMLTAEQEAAGIVGTFVIAAQAVEGLTTHGTSGQRYEAAMALRGQLDSLGERIIGPAYLIDRNTGELVVAVSALQDAARRHTGAGLAHGWLNGRMAALGWDRFELQGYSLPEANGRKAPHARLSVYRGFLPGAEDE